MDKRARSSGHKTNQEQHKSKKMKSKLSTKMSKTANLGKHEIMPSLSGLYNIQSTSFDFKDFNERFNDNIYYPTKKSAMKIYNKPSSVDIPRIFESKLSLREMSSNSDRPSTRLTSSSTKEVSSSSGQIKNMDKPKQKLRQKEISSFEFLKMYSLTPWRLPKVEKEQKTAIMTCQSNASATFFHNRKKKLEDPVVSKMECMRPKIEISKHESASDDKTCQFGSRKELSLPKITRSKKKSSKTEYTVGYRPKAVKQWTYHFPVSGKHKRMPINIKKKPAMRVYIFKPDAIKKRERDIKIDTLCKPREQKPKEKDFVKRMQGDGVLPADFPETPKITRRNIQPYVYFHGNASKKPLDKVKLKAKKRRRSEMFINKNQLEEFLETAIETVQDSDEELVTDDKVLFICPEENLAEQFLQKLGHIADPKDTEFLEIVDQFIKEQPNFLYYLVKIFGDRHGKMKPTQFARFKKVLLLNQRTGLFEIAKQIFQKSNP